jgi:hypothetical protein
MDNNNRNFSNDYTNSFENDLYRILEEFLVQNRRNQNSRNVREPNSGQYNRIHDYSMFIQSLRDIMVTYNTNMQDYQNNITIAIMMIREIITEVIRQNNLPQNVENEPIRTRSNSIRQNPSSQQTSRISRAPTQASTSNSNNREHLLSYTLYRPTIRYQDAQNMRNFFQNISVRPSQEQIQNATLLFTYNDSNSENINQQCPITLEDFENGDIVRQIRHCRHVFHEDSIQNWFQSNVRCPVCRYDIRDYREPTESINLVDTSNSIPPIERVDESGETGDQEEYQNLLENITNNFAQNIQTLFNNNLINDSSQNYLFEFELERNV